MQTFATNANNDLYLGSDGNLVLLAGLAAVVAACKTACETQLAECVLQQGVGLPNFQLIWVGVPDFALWQGYLENTLLSVKDLDGKGVTRVHSIRLSALNNILTYTAEIETSYGPTTITGNIALGR